MALNPNARGKKIGPVVKEYTWRDVILYALGGAEHASGTHL